MSKWPVSSFTLLLLSGAMCTPAAAQSGGMLPEWEIRKMIEEISTETQRLRPLLDQLQPADWVAKGAAETYVTQWKSVRAELGYVKDNLAALAQQPDRLPVALEAFLRMQAVSARVDSLAEGVRRYQNPAAADLLLDVMGANLSAREKLRQYLIDLAASREEEFRLVNREAQRCRESLVQQPLPGKAPPRKRENQ